jgi:hypothetical protein
VTCISYLFPCCYYYIYSEPGISGSTQVKFYVFHFAYWFPCCPHADQIFPKSPAPHITLSTPAVAQAWNSMTFGRTHVSQVIEPSERWVAIRDRVGVVVCRQTLSISELVWQIKQPNHSCTCVFVIIRHFRNLFRGHACRCVLDRVLGISRYFISDYVLEIKWYLSAVSHSVTEKGWLCVESYCPSVCACMTNQATKPQVHLCICHSPPFP